MVTIAIHLTLEFKENHFESEHECSRVVRWRSYIILIRYHEQSQYLALGIRI